MKHSRHSDSDEMMYVAVATKRLEREVSIKHDHQLPRADVVFRNLCGLFVYFDQAIILIYVLSTPNEIHDEKSMRCHLPCLFDARYWNNVLIVLVLDTNPTDGVLFGVE